MNLNRTRFRKVYDCGIVLRIIMILILSSSSSASAETLKVCPINCPYSSIQTAINASTTGDTIEVQSGVYFEHVNVTKQLMLIGSTVPAKPQIIAGGSGSAIMLSANGIVLDGFIATNGNEGISVFSSDNIIKNNSALNNVVGIHLMSTKNNTLSGNNADSNSQKGIFLDFSHNNTLSKNTAISNTGGSAGNYGTGGTVYGIYLNSSTDNTLNSNSANSNTGGSAGACGTGGSGYGIYLTFSIDNTLRDNSANSNTGGSAEGFCMNGGNGGSGYGIYLSSSIGNALNGNSANLNTGGNSPSSNAAYGGSGYGIYLSSSIGNTLKGNSPNSNKGGSGYYAGRGYGIYFISNSNSNTMLENNISSNGNYNIYLSSSSMNTIYHNNMYSSNNAYDNGANSWDNGAEGNNYSDYKGVDLNKDGIGDSPYSIGGGSNVDHYPLMKTYNPSPANITLVSPNGGENWSRGTTKIIIWTSNGNTGANVLIELLDDGVPAIINSSAPNDGSYNWDIPWNQALGKNFKVRITSISNSAYNDTSDANFTITALSPIVLIKTDKSKYSPGETMIVTLDIYNPTSNPLNLEWYMGVPQSNTWVTKVNASIPAGYRKTHTIPMSVGNWGPSPLGLVHYVHILDPTTKEVLAQNAAVFAYSPIAINAPQVDIEEELMKQRVKLAN